MNESAEGSVRSLTPVYIYLCCPVMGLSSLSDDKVKLSAVFRVFPCPRPILSACLQCYKYCFFIIKKPIDVIRFSRIKKYTPYTKYFSCEKKNQTTCAFKITSIVSLCMRGCALEMSKSVK